MFERTLIITPHFDDETIGCGGLISSLSRQGLSLRIVVVATNHRVYNYSANRIVSNDERYSECINALEALGVKSITDTLYQFSGFEDGKLDLCDRRSLVTALDNEIRIFKPTAVLFPYSSHHQDHQVVYQASISALRPTVDTNFIKLKAAYEYPYITTSWNSGMRSDSRLYYLLSHEDMRRKSSALKAYKSQLLRDDRDILSVNSIMNLAKVRGTEVGQEYAEVFYPMSVVMKGDIDDE